MAIPYRGNTSSSTYFVTANTFCKQNLLQSDRMAELFCEVLFRYRTANKFLLHSFVVMPNHIHLLLTIPDGTTLERASSLLREASRLRQARFCALAVQFGRRVFSIGRVRDAEECERYRNYIQQNPVKAQLVNLAGDYIFSSMNPRFTLDELPQRLKPAELFAASMHR